MVVRFVPLVLEGEPLSGRDRDRNWMWQHLAVFVVVVVVHAAAAAAAELMVVWGVLVAVAAVGIVIVADVPVGTVTVVCLLENDERPQKEHSSSPLLLFPSSIFVDVAGCNFASRPGLSL